MVTQKLLAQRLRAAGFADAEFEAKILLETACGDAEMLETLVARRLAREPLQYLCGAWDFLNFTLSVGPGVLIPRPDTEIVAETAIAAAQSFASPRVVDLCSGSGALAIGIARFVPTARVTAVELSQDAYTYLTKNVAALAPQVQTVPADVFLWQQTLAQGSIDVLVCNPPYITSAEMQTLAPELAFEPRMALEEPQDGLAFYRHIAQHYRSAMAPGGTLVLEIGWQQAQAVLELLRASGWRDGRVIKDYGGNDRCVFAKL